MLTELVTQLLTSQVARLVAGELAAAVVAQAMQSVVGSQIGRAAPAAIATVAAPVARSRCMPGADRGWAEVLSSVPGRLRLRVPDLRDHPRRAAELAARVRAVHGVRAVEPNPVTGSVLVRFDPARVDVGAIVAVIAPRPS